ncbi:MAG: subclass B3 metallo-beta-lactamase [Pseudomonadota bacterium]
MKYRLLILLIAALATGMPIHAKEKPSFLASLCPDCATWNDPVKPFKIYGNTWYVGMKNISVLLITSDFGDVLIDGGMPESVPQITANIEALGFKLTDIKAILNSHAHVDHAGGIAQLQRLTGASVYARSSSAEVLRTGKLDKNDPQYKTKAPPIPPVAIVWNLSDDQLLGIGSIRLRVIATPGHTPGGTSWTWESCEKDKCLNMVYADSLLPGASAGFKYSAGGDSGAGAQLSRSIARIEMLPCDVLMSSHPDASGFFERMAQAATNVQAKDDTQCRKYAQAARDALTARLAEEAK